MNNITYAVDVETGFIYSRVGSEIAVPVLDYEGMLPENNFQTSYFLEKMNVLALAGRPWSCLKWTKKISKEIKNEHRKFWGLKPLK